MSEQDPIAEAGNDEQTVIDLWRHLAAEERLQMFKNLPRTDAEELFEDLEAFEQAELLKEMLPAERRGWLRLLAPDDAADLVQQFPREEQVEIISEFDRLTRLEVTALLAYDEDEAGGLMSPRFARLRPEMYVDEALSYLRRQARRQTETMTYAYVLDDQQHLLGVISLRELFTAEPSTKIREVMTTELETVTDTDGEEEVARRLKQSGLVALPVVDESNRMQGIVTVDDVIDVLEESATEDIQKIGGMEALDTPYISTGFLQMLRRRAGWLSALFIGEMFTANAMQHYEDEIAKAVVLALFIPLIISSGGNSGSQASTLIVRSLALGEVRVQHWWKIFIREFGTGLSLGAILGLIGLLRVIYWPGAATLYGEHFTLLGVTVSLSLVCVVLFGTIAGSMLPFILSFCKLDPASASAPFVATIVDVTGVVIYFTVASAILSGTLL
jgi:magnesium transporter